MKGRLILLFVLAALVLWIATLPASLVWRSFGDRLMATNGVGVRLVDGTLWSGTLDGLSLDGRLLGDFGYRLDGWALWRGKADMDWQLAGGDLTGQGRAVMGLFGGALDIEGALEGELVGLPLRLPLLGRFTADIDDLRFVPGEGCRAASGTLWSDALSRSQSLLGWVGPELDGRLLCRDKIVHLPLSGQDAQIRIEALMRIFPDQHWQVDMVVEMRDQAPDEALAGLLPMLGFRADGRRYLFQQASPGAPLVPLSLGRKDG
ncbi:type II secretion system protein N [alpha proteobacterium Q-1]|nr:type II secretion system protein N [alpha proteobacterium Q-1]